MWVIFFVLSVFALVFMAVIPFFVNNCTPGSKRKVGLFNCLFAGVFISAFFVFLPIHILSADNTLLGFWRIVLLSVFNSMQVFAIGCDFGIIRDSMIYCPDWFDVWYQLWAAILFVLAPVFTFGFVLSLFKNISAYFQYLFAFFKDAYIFSELNEKSLTLAKDIKSNNKKAAIVFTDVFEDNSENSYEMIDSAKSIGAICFKKDILVVNFKKHSRNKSLSFITIGIDESENLTQALKLIENYNSRNNTNLYVFSTKTESEILLTAVDKGFIKVRRINEVKSLVYRIIYEEGNILFESAREISCNLKKISAVVVGMGCHGTEMVKALAWYCQMDGYKLEINAFDKDDLAADKFACIAPELMSDKYNGIDFEGEAQYKITVHSGVDVDTITFADKIKEISDATYVIVALGNDDSNIKTAVNLRMYFERMGIHPVIQAIVYNSQQKKALTGITDFSGKEYDIDFIGDMESSYTEDVIIDSDLENEALSRHKKWGAVESFWNYEYNYRSSLASAIHMKARINCGISGASKAEDDLTDDEKNIIAALEHRRWNAYMRAEGFVFSGSKDPSSRNNLAKMHHDLVDYSSLKEEEKCKSRKVGTF